MLTVFISLKFEGFIQKAHCEYIEPLFKKLKGPKEIESLQETLMFNPFIFATQCRRP